MSILLLYALYRVKRPLPSHLDEIEALKLYSNDAEGGGVNILNRFIEKRYNASSARMSHL